MYGVEFWKGNLVRLSDKISEEKIFLPVFFEELKAVGLDKYFDFPECKEPLVWVEDKKGAYLSYYYSGELLAKVKKPSGFFGKPKVVYVSKSVKELKPIDIEELTEVNRPFLQKLEEEAKEYIKEKEEEFKKKTSFVMVSYSGGKDSQVVLDLVFQVLHVGEFLTLFTDTGMELPPTYEVVEETEEFYRKKNPEFGIKRAKNPKETIKLWKEFGPPSRMLRWCCSVYKIAPQLRYLEEEAKKEGKRLTSVLTYEGTRADESQKRSTFERTSPGQKVFKEINVRPILHWNSLEVFLYILTKKLPLNKLYRYGFRRVGCGVCPFASPWSEFLLWNFFKEKIKDFVEVVLNYAENMGVKGEEEKKEYLRKGLWKERSGGLGLDTDVKVEVLEALTEVSAVVENHRENFLEWLKVLGTVEVLENSESIKGEVFIENRPVPFELKKRDKGFEVTFKNLDSDQKLRKRLRGVINKSAFCVHCVGCEVECPFGALTTYPKVKVKTDSCTYCGKCIDFIDAGCYVAKSFTIHIAGGSGKKAMKRKRGQGINRYFTFGLRESWLEGFLNSQGNWFKENSLGPEQRKAFVNFLKDAELINEKKEPTELLQLLTKLKEKDSSLVWQVVWVNLCLNSGLFNWYSKRVPWGKEFSKEELIEKLVEEASLGKRTARNAINSLTNT
ncbi:MAG: phosphoadenosine phosphosulfate reductase, partial [Desulfurobacterium sp.]